MKKSVFLVCLSVCLLSGCWTVHETERPTVSMVSLPSGKEVRVQLEGFDASVTKYVPVYGYSLATTFGGGVYHRGPRRRYYDWGPRTSLVSTTEFQPHVTPTAAYRNQATDLLERAGCILQTTDPQYRVMVRFEGPFQKTSDRWASAGWTLGTLFTADYAAQNWTAKLKIHDVKTGKLVFEKECVQRYETIVWGPIPFFSPQSSDKTSESVMQNWCLSALTESAIADALAFFKANAH